MRFYSVIEAARLLNVNPETVRRWIRESRIDCLPGAGRHGYRITSDHLRAYAAKNPAALTPELLREFSEEEVSAAAKTGNSELDELQVLRLKKIEELERLDAMIWQKKLDITKERRDPG